MTEIGILSVDTGDYDAYIAFFEDPGALERTVARLNAERLDRESGELAGVEAHRVTLRVCGEPSEETLDLLADLLNDHGYNDIESSRDRETRLREEAEEAAIETALTPLVISPGQTEAGL